MESNAQLLGQAYRSRLGDLRIGSYDRIDAQRYLEQGELLADLLLRASRGVRALMNRAVQAAHNALAPLLPGRRPIPDRQQSTSCATGQPQWRKTATNLQKTAVQTVRPRQAALPPVNARGRYL